MWRLLCDCDGDVGSRFGAERERYVRGRDAEGGYGWIICQFSWKIACESSTDGVFTLRSRAVGAMTATMKGDAVEKTTLLGCDGGRRDRTCRSTFYLCDLPAAQK
jgi:hypothetical protein